MMNNNNKYESDIMSSLTKPSDFLSQLNSLNEKLPHILDDFQKYYVFYNKNPEYTEYQNAFENIKSNLQKINSEQSMITSNIQKGTDYINQKLQTLDLSIESEKKKNKELKRKLGIIESKSDGSSEMISNYKEMYNMYYMKNFGVLLGMLLCILVARKITTA